MKHVPENELFSAYLDGELTADEQARVEHLLQTSPDARQLLEELRAISHTLQSLPGERLHEDLSPQILREAERRMLAEAPQPLTSPGRGDAAGLDWTMLLRRLLRPRVVVWSALAVVIALAVSKLDLGRRELAQTPRQGGVVAARVAESPRDGTRQKPAGMSGARTEAASRASDSKPADLASAATGRAIPTISSADAPAASSHGAVSSASTTPKGPPTIAAAGATPTGRRDKAADKPAKAEPALAALPAKAAAANQSVPSSVPKAAQQETAKTTAESQRLLIVRCDIRAGDWKEGALDRLLAEHHVARQPDAVGDKIKLPDALEATAPGKTVRVWAEASGDQLAAVLAQMKARGKVFSSVALAPSSASHQPGDTSPKGAVAASEPVHAVAASVQVQTENPGGKAKASPKSRVIFEPNATPPPAPEAGSISQGTPADPARPVVFVVHILAEGTTPPPAAAGQ